MDIDLPGLLSRIRAGLGPEKKAEGVGVPSPVKAGLRGFRLAATLPGLFGFGQRILGWMASILPAYFRIPAFTGWGFSKDFPRPVKPFRARWKNINSQAKEDIVPTEDDPVESSGPEIPVAQRPMQIQFMEELSALGGHVSLVQPHDIAPTIVNFLKEREVDRIQAWEEIPGLDLARLTEAGIRVERIADPVIKAGLTSALAGISDTGTLVVTSREGQPLTASLMPEIHIAVLPASRLKSSLPEALRLPEVRTSPAIVMITGPSRTADIEMTLTIGVHGPKELHVFLVDDS